ncbi:MAG: acyl-CoA dehydrogenase family protein, partial [Chloroflexota bacterium]
SFSDARDRRLQLLEQNVTHLAAEAVDVLWRTAGTSSAKTGGRLLRYFRDMSVLRTHIAAQFENGYTGYARLHFGLPPAGPAF